MRRPALRGLVCLLVALPLLGKVSVDVPFVRQEKNGCGAASVAMVMQYWTAERQQDTAKGPAPIEIYNDLYRPDLRSITLLAMRQYLDRHGFHAFTLRGGMPDLELHISKGRPIIVGLRKRPKANIHFAVFAGLDNEWVWLNDPTKRKPRRMKRAKFERSWSLADGWLLLAAPSVTNQ